MSSSNLLPKPTSFWMDLALSLARSAAKRGEVPVGALIVHQQRLLCTAFNQREQLTNACAHAEVLVIQRACELLQKWRLSDCELYVTLEPCPMCAGAIINARIPKVFYAAKDPKAGAMGSLFQMHDDDRLNHRVSVDWGVRDQASATLLKDFFRARRQKQKQP